MVRDAASARARDRSIERTGSARWTPRGAMAPFVARATHRKRRRGGVRGRELVRERGRRAPEGALRCEIGGVGGGSASRAGEGGGGAGGGFGSALGSRAMDRSRGKRARFSRVARRRRARGGRTRTSRKATEAVAKPRVVHSKRSRRTMDMRVARRARAGAKAGVPRTREVSGFRRVRRSAARRICLPWEC